MTFCCIQITVLEIRKLKVKFAIYVAVLVYKTEYHLTILALT